MSVEVVNVSKKFDIGFKKQEGALGRLVSTVSGREAKKELMVLRDISFEVKPGEIVGLIGKNGSGKSTLLRIIAGIYQPDSGQVLTQGRVDYLSGLNNGLNPRLTMEENIFLMGSIIGLNRQEISDKFDEIVEFSGLSNFISTKVYQFSSGMLTRLGFSTTMHCLSCCQPKVLLLDEVFGSGGDIDFEKKASKKMLEFMKSGAVVILASHNLNAISERCNRVLMLSCGKIAEQGKAGPVIEKYKKTGLGS